MKKKVDNFTFDEVFECDNIDLHSETWLDELLFQLCPRHSFDSFHGVGYGHSFVPVGKLSLYTLIVNGVSVASSDNKVLIKYMYDEIVDCAQEYFN